VYRTYQPSLKVERAIKVLPLALAQQSGYVERFNREAEIVAALECPHIGGEYYLSVCFGAGWPDVCHPFTREPYCSPRCK